jgi:DNA end-binding protein Ku
MLDADGTPLARRYYCPADAREVDADHLERGYALDDGTIVVVADEELEALAPKKSREIDLRRFVDRDSIDPLYFERSYFLAPGKGSGKAYRLLAAVMESSRRAGIATFVMREKEYLVAIFAEGGLLRGETLRFADEVRSARAVGLSKAARVDAAAVKRMARSVRTLAKQRWDASELSDPHEAVRQLAERKYRKKQDVIRSRAAARDEGGEVIDLMQMLRESLAQNDLAAKNGRRTRRAKPAGRTKPAARKKRAARTTTAAGRR